MEMRCYPKYYASHTKTVLPTRKSMPNPASNRTTRKSPDHRKETQSAVVWTCLPFIRSGQNHFARHSERGKKTRQTEGEVGRQHREWTSLEFAKSQRAVENREEWRKLIVKSSVVPQWPPWLWDRWRWSWCQCHMMTMLKLPDRR